MRKSVPIFVILACMASGAVANEVTGVVRDTQGSPVANAQVEVVGANMSVRTDEKGEFELENLPAQEVELHVMAPGYSHRIVHVRPGQEQSLELRLARSAIEVVDVIGLPWHASILESALPINVLTGDALRKRQAATLGDTLKNEVGIHTSYYGPVASSPVIRGLEGPRVMVTQNGFDAGDASRVGPDHVVATEATTARQIEILRGPATLFYGSGAIGGVVNIIDNRIPQDNLTQGEWLVQHNTVADENVVSGSITSGNDQFAVHLDGFWRESNDYRVPVAADLHDDGAANSRRLDNSAYDGQGFNLGGSYLLDRGFAGLSYGRIERTYGIPGHSHGDEYNEGDLDVYADLEQDRIQFHSELSFDHPFLSALNTRIGYTDYTHHEIEGGQPVTTFDNTSYEVRGDFFHHPFSQWSGALTLQYKYQDFSALGVEAFTPPSTTETAAVALLEERHFGDVLLQLGARLERVEISSDNVLVLGEHSDGEDDHSVSLSAYSVEHVFEPVSVSVGAVWDFTQGYNVGLSLSHAQRAPSAAELLSHGPHIGTDSYEMGALFELHREGEDFYFDLNSSPIELEKSNNIDLSLRKLEGDFGFVINTFYNRMDNFYYLQETGLTAGSDHGHEHEHESSSGEEEGLPLYIFSARDARLYGIESKFEWQLNQPLKVTLFSDYTRAKLRNGGNLPRIPPLRLGSQLNYQANSFSAELSIYRYAKQSKVGALETETPGYTLVDAQVGYHLNAAGQDITLFLQGSNITNEEARPHTSFLKNVAPLPSRAITAGIRARF